MLRKAEVTDRYARAEGFLLVDVSAGPPHHPRAKVTDGYALRMARQWPLIIMAADPKHEDWPAAVGLLKAALRKSGVGEQIQRDDGIAALQAGDPAVQHVGNHTRRLADGSTVIVPPDGTPPLVVQGRATPVTSPVPRHCRPWTAGPAPR